MNVGIPRYLHGHNAGDRDRKPPKPRQPCECGCGALATSGRRYVSGHNAFGRSCPPEVRRRISAAHMGKEGMRGEANPNYIRGWHLNRTGYRVLDGVYAHPFATSGGRIFEHRVVLERHLRVTAPASPYLIQHDGQWYLDPTCDVHHIDGDKLNNEPRNLMALTKSEHARLHAQLRR